MDQMLYHQESLLFHVQPISHLVGMTADSYIFLKDVSGFA